MKAFKVVVLFESFDDTTYRQGGGEFRKLGLAGLEKRAQPLDEPVLQALEHVCAAPESEIALSVFSCINALMCGWWRR